MALADKLLPQRFSKSKKVTPQDLRLFNLVAFLLYAFQAILILLLSNPDRGLKPITTSFLGKDELASANAEQTVLTQGTQLLFDINLTYLVAAFLLLGAVIHLLIATRYRVGYEIDLKNRASKARWTDFSLSFGLVMVSVAILSGIFDLASLIMILALTAVLGVMGLVSERSSAASSGGWLPFVEGIKFSLVPWLVILIYFWGAHAYGNAIPTFVYWIYFSVFVLFCAFLVNFYLVLKRIGHWESYFFGEKAFIMLLFVVKSALAWQIFAGTLR